MTAQELNDAYEAMTKYLYGDIYHKNIECWDIEHIAEAEKKLAEEILQAKGIGYSVGHSARGYISSIPSGKYTFACANWWVTRVGICIFEVGTNNEGTEPAARLACWYKMFSWWQDYKQKEGE